VQSLFNATNVAATLSNPLFSHTRIDSQI